MRVALAIIHHANQYLITDGYENRTGLREVLGSKNAAGLRRVLDAHARFGIPANLHISGTLLEAIAWHDPEFLSELTALYRQGVVELVGSCYGQNLMRFFSYRDNFRQLQEQFRLYKDYLSADVRDVSVFWPPERLWDTERMADVLTDPRLLNGGYQYVVIDDRVLLSVCDAGSPRHQYDHAPEWRRELFQPWRIADGHGLIALPISSTLRHSIPPTRPEHWRELERQIEWLAASTSEVGDQIAIYGDDMEKPAAVGGWEAGGPDAFEQFLRWVDENSSVRPVKLGEWAETARIAGTKQVETGTFRELANHFHAGEDCGKWYFAADWERYRGYFDWSKNRVEHLASLGAEGSLIGLARKHLLTSAWETAWHTPPSGPHGDPSHAGQPTPWIRAIASHSRHAAVIAEAAYWMRHKTEDAHAYVYDIDNDGEDEIVMKNECLFAVLTPRWGGRLVYLFVLDGPRGAMVIGNPSDDWNWMEELNKHMEVPANHPGALAGQGFENDCFEPQEISGNGAEAWVVLRNVQRDSMALGLCKEIRLRRGENRLTIAYQLTGALPFIDVVFGLSPDYENLLRSGKRILSPVDRPGARGWKAMAVAVWVEAQSGTWLPEARLFGHGMAMTLHAAGPRFTVRIGATAAQEGGGEK